jgi:hypothetical protein
MNEPTQALETVNGQTPSDTEQEAELQIAIPTPMPTGLPMEQDILQLGRAMASSGFFKDAQRASQAIVKILAGRELGFGPVASMVGVHIIKDKVSLSANLMAAAIKRTGRYNYRLREHSATACCIEFFEGGESVGVSEFTMQDATQAGLLSNPTWKSYPRNMLFARAMSNGARWYCPDVFGGPVYTPEELGRDDLEPAGD